MNKTQDRRKFFRLIVTRIKSDPAKWVVVSNPVWDMPMKAASDILLNEYNEYVEYSNSGCVHRVIRFKDWDQYVRSEPSDGCLLDPRDQGACPLLDRAWIKISDRHPQPGQMVMLRFNPPYDYGDFECVWPGDKAWSRERKPEKWKPLRIS